ncbi:NAD(P)H-dependent flavin oxidoreductase [Heyndrickxia ginsengihumi]|uniref:NAD(P)H-dependent flavin oxidoreductase n=1 Tax=Heyndrickxia ginsengihumi TaxID=363870 RepID=UPI003D1F1DAE
MWNNTQVTNMLSIQYPIIQAGMAGGVTSPELVAAVSNAGALGSIGAGYMTMESLENTIQTVKTLTTNPFSVNIFVPEQTAVTEEEIASANELLNPIRKQLGMDPTYKRPMINDELFHKQIDLIIQHRVPICSFTFGIPPKNEIARLKEKGIILIGTATSVNEALLNEKAGMDMIVAQGSEAGGHRGSFATAFDLAMIGTMALVPQIVDAVSIPVIAAGGIMDGRGVLASLILGAQAVQTGTAFVTCIESGAHPLHKQAILEGTEDQTVVTATFSGKPARGMNNKFIQMLQDQQHNILPYPYQNVLTQDIRKEAGKQNRPEFLALWSGQHPRSSRQIHAAELIMGLAAQVRRLAETFS